MNAIPYRLQLLEPLLVTQPETGEENSAVGTLFVPGSTVRGAIIARYLQDHPAADIATDPILRHWFLDGTTCFLNAYPWDGYRCERVLPTPASWFTEKEAKGEDPKIVDWAVDPSQPLDEPKTPRDATFCLISRAETEGSDFDVFPIPETRPPQVVFHQPARQVDVHIALVDPNRRGDENKVYRYDALAAETTLAGTIVAHEEMDLAPLHALLRETPELLLGRAHKAGYGRTRLEVDPIVRDWQEYTPGKRKPDSPIIVTLLSDTLVRGREGQIDGDLDLALAHLLDLDTLQAERRYRSLGLIGGFNRKWSLPMPQAWALRAGTVYVYNANAFDPGHLRQLAAGGVGERRAEGFGRLAVDWQTAPVLQQQPASLLSSRRPPLAGESQDLARRMATRRLRLLLEQGLTRQLSNVEFRWLPPRTQLSRVRNAVRDALAQGTIDPVTAHLAHLTAGRAQLSRARLNGESMLRWIEARLGTLDVEAQLLGGPGHLPRIAGEEAVLDADLKRTYTLRLIDSMMQMATREAEKEGA